MGYNTIVINFRDIGRGDCWNPLALPYSLYHSDNKELATAMLNDFVAAISEDAKKGNMDPFWIDMACSLALANLLLLMECGTEQQANVGNLAVLCSNAQRAELAKLATYMTEDTVGGLNYKNVFNAPEKTLGSIIVTLFSMIRVFVTQKQLVEMLSANSVDLRSIGREKTAAAAIAARIIANGSPA
jgi:type IV secretion system protein VirD4